MSSGSNYDTNAIDYDSCNWVFAAKTESGEMKELP